MTDKELLELAAKAIGLTLRYNYLGGRDANQPWDPLEDDGDALRLAVELKMTVTIDDSAYTFAEAALFNEAVFVDAIERHEKSDPYAATRRAIVRAAAEIGRNVK